MREPKTYGDLADAGAPMCQAFDLAMELWQAARVPPVAGRVWQHAWMYQQRAIVLRMNGTKQMVDYIAPVNIGIDVDGLPALSMSPFDGVAVGDGEAFVVAAMEAEIARLKATPPDPPDGAARG